MYEQYVVKNKQKLQQIEKALFETYFTNYDAEFLLTETGRADIEANVSGRYNNALKHVVPWVANHIELQGKTLAEVGCGTGASTAAFAHFVKEIVGYDIDAQAVSGARVRMEVMGFSNVQLHLVSPEELVTSLRKNHEGGIDIVLLFAVLEHQTIEERHETIRLCWELLNPDGLLVVADTPNLLYYFDLHTSQLPFLHLLPSELYVRYANRSPREGFASSFPAGKKLSCKELDTSIMRWGRGVSYHDFELAMGSGYDRYLVANGFEKEMLDWIGISFEEELLRQFFLIQKLEVPLAFSRVVLNIIFKKKEGLSPCNSRIPKNKYVVEMHTISEQGIDINTLQDRLHTAEQQLNEMLSSRRWRLGNYLAGPYRKVKSLFSRSGF